MKALKKIYKACEIDENFTVDGERVVDVDRDDELCIIHLENGNVLSYDSWEEVRGAEGVN